ncbi:MAG: PAS domain-containing protein [Planctomycetota bacterium]
METEQRLKESSHFLEGILENVPIMVFLKRASDLRFEYFNRAGELLLGIPRDRLLGCNDHDFFPKDQADFFTRKDREVLEQDGVVDIPEETIDTPHGPRILHTRKLALRNERGEPEYLLGISEDITARIKAERTLRENERRFTTLVTHVPGAAYQCELDAQWTVRYLGASIESLTGYPPSDFIGNAVRSYASIIHPDDINMVDTEVNKAILTRKPWVIEYRILHANGGVRWVHEKGQAIHHEDGSVESLAGFIHDITDKKLLEIELQNSALSLAEQSRALEASNADLVQFAHVASHDIKAPLRGIETLIQFIEEDVGNVLSASSKVDFGKIKKRVERLRTLVNDLLDYAKLGGVGSQPATFDLHDLVKSLADFVAFRQAPRIRLEGAFPVITTQRAPLELVLRNLISNAISHHDKPEALEIAIACTPEASKLRFEVTDNGPGIPPEFHKLVFEMFKTLQAPSSTSGSGMGLSVVQRILERFGGDIRIISPVAHGRGTAFIFTWPLETMGSRP